MNLLNYFIPMLQRSIIWCSATIATLFLLNLNLQFEESALFNQELLDWLESR